MGSKTGLMINREDFETEVLSFWQVSWVTWGKLPTGSIFKASAPFEYLILNLRPLQLVFQKCWAAMPYCTAWVLSAAEKERWGSYRAFKMCV